MSKPTNSRTHRVLLLLALVASACSAPLNSSTNDVAGGQERLTDDAFSPNGQAVIKALRDGYPDEEASTWAVSGDGQLGADWLVQTPVDHWNTPVAFVPTAEACEPTEPGCDPDFGLRLCNSQDDCTTGLCETVEATVNTPGDAPRSMCLGHSDALVDTIYEMIVSAESKVDIVSLTPPDGRFETAVRNAITYLHRMNRRVDVRGLFASAPLMEVDMADVLKSWTRDLPENSTVHVNLAGYRKGIDSWNHAKIIAVDGREALVGGHNMWTDHYLTFAPVHDLSMRLEGSAVDDAHRFADKLWDFACDGSVGFLGKRYLSHYPAAAGKCAPSFGAPMTERLAGGTRVITVGRTGSIGANPADEAITALLDSAKESIHLSLQDLGPMAAGPINFAEWPLDTLGAMVRAAVRGVDVYLVLSNVGAVPGGLAPSVNRYSNGWSFDELAKQMKSWAAANADQLVPGVDLESLLCERIRLARLRTGPDEAWTSGDTFANHAKFILVDDQTFYIGSQNLYKANLAEMGYIVDDAAAARSLRNQYWDLLWQNSARTMVSGEESASCVF